MGKAETTRAVVLVSGGLDSAVCLAAARADGLACHCLSIDYGQRHRHELTAAAHIASLLGACEHVVLTLDLRAFGGSSLTADIPVPRAQEHPGATNVIPSTYVPARNLVFLSLAVAFAETRGASRVVIGANAVDYSGYPDCRPAFINAFERTANLATKAGAHAADKGQSAFAIHAPLVDLSKAEIIRLGHRLGVDFSLTHSCYDPTPDGAACGVCESCVLRSRGFAAAGVADPTRYTRTRGADT
ncbi:MAG: 7-cyano-7-deazaguanine synthase QueC [Phycisphaerales bacterium]|nr:7-cyano-7-deazaguanine synthase QueC [Phycisphaerales bacterium]